MHSETAHDTAAPPLAQRIAIAGLVALVLGGFALLVQGQSLVEGKNPDTRWFWESARLLLAGRDPYTALPWARGTALPDPLYYPLVTLMPWLALAPLDFLTASVLFVALGGGLAAWALSRDGVWRLWIFASLPVMVAAQFGQWGTWLLAGTLSPWLAFLLPMKPNVGLACLLAVPTWRRALIAGAAVVLPTVLLPAWPLEWLANTRHLIGHPPPIVAFPPVTLLLAAVALKWRRPDARLVLAMACVPQLPFYADQLPLLLVAAGRRQLMLLVATGWVSFFLGRWATGTDAILVKGIVPWVLAGTYLPATLLVLARPNVGVLPEWLERAVGRLPAWIRGTPGGTVPRIG